MSLSRSGICYLSHVWNVAVGCERGCPYCWARERWAPRMAHTCQLCGTFTPHIHPERLKDVTPRQSPKTVGLGFFGDLFGPWDWVWPMDGDVGTRELCELLCKVMAVGPQHTFIAPTKFPENIPAGVDWPENWWLLVTCTNQADVDERAPAALAAGVPHVVLNLEPLCGPLDLRYWLAPTAQLDADRQLELGPSWFAGVILGGMSGQDATPMAHDIPRSVRDQCAEAGIPYYLKQWSAANPGDVDESGAPILDGTTHRRLPWIRKDTT